MHVTGNCHCGSVSFSADVDESKVVICHCTDCQVQASAPYRFGALILRDGFTIQGPTKDYCKVGSSGNRRVQVFCPECATGIYSYEQGNHSPYFSLRLGGVHQRAQLMPKLQIWRQSALPWVDGLPSIPGCAQQDILSAEISPSHLSPTPTNDR